MSDATIARIGRTLGLVLIQYAREREPEHAKQIRMLHTELCAAVRQEHEEQRQEQEPS